MRNINCTYICSVIIQVILLKIKTQNIKGIKKRGKKERKDFQIIIDSLLIQKVPKEKNCYKILHDILEKQISLKRDIL